jgi:cell division protease FtsH
MITEYGMSKRLGPRTFGQRQEIVFLGKEISEHRDYSDKTAERIDAEIKDLIKGANDRAHGILNSHSAQLVYLAKTLMEKETLEGPELVAVLKADPPPEDTDGPLEASVSDVSSNGAQANEGASNPAAEPQVSS